jgi:transcriptional regulator with XRE-family HTH domain
MDRVPRQGIDVDDDPFPLGVLVREARLRAGLTVRGLAQRAGVHPSHVSRVERGLAWPSGTALRELLEAAGMRFEVAVVPMVRPVLDPDGVDATAVLANAGLDPVPLTHALSHAGVPYRLMGSLAAVLQGLPMAVVDMVLAVPKDRIDDVGAALVPWLTGRWRDDWGEFDWALPRSPAEPGADRWRTDGGELRVQWVESESGLPPGVQVVVEYDRDHYQRVRGHQVPERGEHTLMLAGLGALAVLDPRIGRRLARAVGSAG